MPNFVSPSRVTHGVRVCALTFSLIGLLPPAGLAKDSSAPTVGKTATTSTRTGAAISSAKAPAASSTAVSTGSSTVPTIKTDAAADGNVQKKRSPQLTDPPTGARTPQALAQKLADAYKNRDTTAYLALLKASVRTRIRMQLLFKRESGYPVSNFKYVTLDQEAARLKVKKETLIGPAVASGTEEKFELPVCGFVNYEFATTLSGRPDIESVAVGKNKDTYFLQVRRVPKVAKPSTPAEGSPPTAVEGQAAAPANPAAAAQPAPASASPGAAKPKPPNQTHTTRAK